MFSHDVTLEFAYPSPRVARLVEEAVALETAALEDDRSRTTLERDGRHLTLGIQATDLTALRAACNTWCTLVDVAEQSAAIGRRRGYLDHHFNE